MMNNLLYIFLFIGSFTYGQNEWSLQQCIDSALVNNSEIQLSKINFNVSQVEKKNSIYSFLPNLNGGATHGYNWGQTIDPFTNQFATDRVQYNNFYLNSSVTIFSGLQNVYSKRIIDLDSKYQALNLSIVKRNKSIEIVTSYLQASLNHEIIDISREAVNQTLAEQKRIEALVDEEFSTNSDLLKIQAELARNRHQLNQAKSDYKNSVLVLQQLMGIKYDSIFTVNTKFRINDNADLTCTSTELELSELKLKKQEAEVKRAKSQFSPSITLNGSLGSGYSENNKVLAPDGSFIPRPFSDQVNENFYQSASATLSIPIFNNNRNNTAVKISELEAQRVRIENKQLIRDYENRILQLKQEVKNNQSLAESAAVMQEFTQIDFENNKLLYEHGEINTIEFLRSKNEYFRAESILLQAKYKLEFSEMILEYY